MKILVEVGEAADRFEEIIELATRGDQILICRGESPIATLSYIAKKDGAIDEFVRLAAEGRAGRLEGAALDHDDLLYDQHGLPR